MHNAAENSVIKLDRKQKNEKIKLIDKVRLNFKFKWKIIIDTFYKVKDKFEQYPKNIKLVIISVSVSVLIIAVMLFSSIISSFKTQDNIISAKNANSVNQSAATQPLNPIHEQLEDISAKLANLEKNLSGSAYVDLDSVRGAITGLQNQVSNLAQNSNQILTKQIQSSTEQLQGQLVGIKKELLSLNEQKKHHRYLEPSKLPFNVADISNIQQSDIVTISYANKIFPLYAGDAIAGWTLTQANSVNQTAEFKNKENNYIHINLNS